DDAEGRACSFGSRSGTSGLRRRRTRRAVAGNVRSASGGPAGRDAVTTPILLIHAFPVDAAMWEPQVSGIAGRAVLAPNLPGFGGTESSEPVLTMRAGARACVEALNEA